MQIPTSILVSPILANYTYNLANFTSNLANFTHNLANDSTINIFPYM